MEANERKTTSSELKPIKTFINDRKKSDIKRERDRPTVNMGGEEKLFEQKKKNTGRTHKTNVVKRKGDPPVPPPLTTDCLCECVCVGK